ncbi:MAG TPA: hypothetical protein VD994_21630, partial [Prosthecobacter sp.]|nr:hypothetical protein [Prosthecobacter sp.]
IGIGYWFTYKLMTTERQFTEAGGMTGIATIYLFFANLIFPGFAICLMLLLRKFTFVRLLATLAGGVIPMMNVLGLRREPIALLAMTIALTIFYVWRRPPPRLAIFGALFMAMLIIPATGTYRGMLSEGTDWSKFSPGWLMSNFESYFNQESVLELRNGAAVIESTQRFSQYDFGAGYWNQMVFRYIPAQFVGLERKNALLIGTTVQQMLAGRTTAGYEFNTGSTVTGMGDAFQHFGWFGCLFFALMAVFFRSVWLASLQPHGIFAQLLYILICTSAMRALTHQTVDFLPGLFYQLIFLSMGMLYARERGAPVVPVRRR